MSILAGRSRSRSLAATLLAAGLLLAAGCDDPAEEPEVETGSGADPAELESVEADAGRLAPALEQYFFSHEYALTLDEALAAMADAGLEPTAPNVVGSYAYDAETVEFVLCIESPSGTGLAADMGEVKAPSWAKVAFLS